MYHITRYIGRIYAYVHAEVLVAYSLFPLKEFSNISINFPRTQMMLPFQTRGLNLIQKASQFQIHSHNRSQTSELILFRR